jgi:hypothetical protein
MARIISVWHPIPFATIEVSTIGDNMRNPLLRHSGEGRNPACPIAPRSGQSRNYFIVPLRGVLSFDWIPAFSGMTAAEDMCNELRKY